MTLWLTPQSSLRSRLMTQNQRDCLKMIALVLALDWALFIATDWLAEHGKAVAVAKGCHSPRCFRLEWVWE